MVWLGLLLAVVFGLGVSFLPKRAPVSDEIVPKRTTSKVKQSLGKAISRGQPGSARPSALINATLGRWAAGLQKAFGNPERLGFAAAAGLALLIALGPGLAGSSTGLWLWSSLVAALCGFAAGPGMASVARGVREQPGTYLYVFPAMIGMIVLVFIPFVMGVALAFFSNGEFTGLSNFTEILAPSATAHTTFYSTTGFTILWTLSNVVLHVVIGVSLALVLNRKHLTFKGLYRVLLVVPWAVPNYITALIWKSMFNPQFGAVNGLLDVFGIEPVNWLGAGSSFASNYIAALTTNTWLGFPFMMVVTLGALQSIPTDLYEAADIDGATRWQKFRKVTLPLLKPALVPAIILGVIWTFNMFNVIYLVSGGAPENETNILVTEAYYAFKVLNRFGLAAAYSLLIFVILLLYGWMQNRITRATEGAFE
ncbi:MAG: sugar ABC transporter permease [Deltaproteobacteria bacterium]|nr:sugar ABC transporter permease [Deltaproteobacteria bacterium]